jgi:hypothetical protein
MGAFERIARLVGRHWRASLAASLSLATGNTLFPPASAFDLLNLFGLFGSEEAPPVSADAVAYQLTFEGLAGDKDLLRALQDVSILHRLRQEPPPDGDGVVPPRPTCPALPRPSGVPATTTATSRS